MKAFRVCFFNALPDCTGHDHKCCQRTVDIAAAQSVEHAVELAKREFERLEEISHWRLHAKSLECQPLN